MLEGNKYHRGPVGKQFSPFQHQLGHRSESPHSLDRVGPLAARTFEGGRDLRVDPGGRLYPRQRQADRSTGISGRRRTCRGARIFLHGRLSHTFRYCIAAPVRDKNGQAVAALCFMTQPRHGPEQACGHAGRPSLRSAKNIIAALLRNEFRNGELIAARGIACLAPRNLNEPVCCRCSHFRYGSHWASRFTEISMKIKDFLVERWMGPVRA